MSGLIPVAGSVEMITDKKRDREIDKLTKQIGKDQEELAILQKKVKDKIKEVCYKNYKNRELPK